MKATKPSRISPTLVLPTLLVALVMGALFLINHAHAAPISRNTCFQTGQQGDRGRQMGARNATRIFNALWSRLGQTCDQLDRLGQIISETPLARSSIGGVFSACFYQGYTDALWDQLAAAYDRCQVRCFNEGSAIGDISAQGYCAASIAVGGLDDPGFIAQPPLPFCGESMVFGCKSQYLQTAQSRVQGCFPFTTGYFAQTFENSIRQDCFVPSDVPIRDRIQLADQSWIDLGNSSSLASASVW